MSTATERKLLAEHQNLRKLKAELKTAQAVATKAVAHATKLRNRVEKASVWGVVEIHHDIPLVMQRSGRISGPDVYIRPLHEQSRSYRSARVYTNAHDTRFCGLELMANIPGEIRDGWVHGTHWKRKEAEAAAILYVAKGEKPATVTYG